jgi:hypothetical protein
MIERVIFGSLAALCSLSARRFLKGAMEEVPVFQAHLLAGYLRRGADTALGRSLGLSGAPRSKDPETVYQWYSRHVPVTGYQRIRPFVDRIKRGETRQVCPDRVRVLEPTSGSTGGTKLIPYGDRLQSEYLAGIKPWITDLLSRFPRAGRGAWYWSLSPAGQKSEAGSAVPVGFRDDSAYTGAMAALFRRLFPVPAWVKGMNSLRNFRYVTCLYLLAAARLTLISVWSPSFLTLLLEDIREVLGGMLLDLGNQRVSLPEPDPADMVLCRRAHPAVSAKRLRDLEKLLHLRRGITARALWPDLVVISCWTDGPSRSELSHLERLIEGVPIHQKGLLATEGIFTIPLTESSGCVPAYRSHFLEFRRPDGPDLGPLRRIHELEDGGVYELVVTTGGGLYRYPMRDLVRVRSHWRTLPVLEFLGRAGTSDLVGEKLSAPDALRALGTCGGVFLSPIRPETGRPYYALFGEPGWRPPPGSSDLAEEALQGNFYYRHAVELGQLQRVRLFRLNSSLAELRQQAANRLGRVVGDVKPASLGLVTEEGLWLLRNSLSIEESR